MYQISENEFKDAMNYCMLNDDMEKVIKSSKHETFDKVLSPEMLQRKREKVIRDELKSMDGDTAEIYDQVL